jgi:GT2 family glycosyltransferase
LNDFGTDGQPASHIRVVAVILNWNGAQLVRECLHHVTAQTLSPRRVVMVDNGSSDDSVAQLTSLTGPLIELIRLEQNLGFAAGMNVGIERARVLGGDYVWLLNSDAFPEPPCLAHLVASMDSTPSLAMVTPRLLGLDGIEQHAGGWLNLMTADAGFRSAAELAGPASLGTWVTGTAPLIRMTALSRVGNLDPGYFAYWEDVDLSLRLVDDGGDLRAIPDAIVQHIGNATSGGRMSASYFYLMARNEWRLVRSRTRGRRLPGALLRYCARQVELAGSLGRAGRQGHARAVLRAMMAALLGRAGAPPRRPDRPAGARLVHRSWRITQALDTLARALDRVLRVDTASPYRARRHQ